MNRPVANDVVTPPAFYSSPLNTRVYDLGVGRGAPDGGEDITFYAELVRSSGPRVLELGVGTGRVAVALATAGFQVTGLDHSPGMLKEAKRKLERLDPTARGRVNLVEGDLVDFDLGATFDVVLAPARVFAFLLTPEEQLACLARVRAHLRAGGNLAIDIFDPRLDLCIPGAGGVRTDSRIDPATGNTIRVDILDRVNDPVAQTLRERWRFSEIDPRGVALAVEEETLQLRWTYRHEMRHLLTLAGFVDITEASDFAGSPPAYGREQVWICRRPLA